MHISCSSEHRGILVFFSLSRPFDDNISKKEEPDRDPCGAASPRVGLHLRRGKSELPADTQYLPGETPPTEISAVLPEKYLTGSGRPDSNTQSGSGTNNMAHAQDGPRVRSATLRRGRTIKLDSREEVKARLAAKMNTVVNGQGRNSDHDVNGRLPDQEGQKMKPVFGLSAIGCQTILPPTTPALTMCRHMVEAIRDRLQSKALFVYIYVPLSRHLHLFT